MSLRSAAANIIDHKATPYVVASLIILIMLLPILWTTITSLKTLKEAFATPPTYWPNNLTLQAYKDVLTNTPVPMYIMNSIIYSLATVACVLGAGVFSAYGLSKYPYRGSNFILVSFLVTRILPPLALCCCLFT